MSVYHEGKGVSLTRLAVVCSEQILERKKQALQAKEASEQEQLRNVEADKQAREAQRSQAKARRIVEAQRAQQRAALDLQQKTAYFQVSHSPTTCGLRQLFWCTEMSACTLKCQLATL